MWLNIGSIKPETVDKKVGLCKKILGFRAKLLICNAVEHCYAVNSWYLYTFTFAQVIDMGFKAQVSRAQTKYCKASLF